MSMEEVEMAVGEATSKVTTSDGVTEWMYPRSNSILVVQFNEDGIVKKAGARSLGSGAANTKKRRMAEQSAGGQRLTGSGFKGNGTPLQ
jgi:hypothetical protein